MIRIVEKRPNREHSAPLFKKNNILPIKDSITFYEGTFMDGQHSGEGKIIFPDGSFYTGYWLALRNDEL